VNLQLYKDEIRPLLPGDNNLSYTLMWRMLHRISMLKFVQHRHLTFFKPEFNKVCAKDRLNSLCDLNYLKKTNNGVYSATKKTLALLDELKDYDRELLPKVSGDGGINELNNTDALVKLMKEEPYFFNFLYPRFPYENPYVKPDALMVLKDDNKYKLIFLEIEASKKPNWDQYIFTKKLNYERLSKDVLVYQYWKGVAKKLDLPVPNISEFFFSVRFIGDIKFDDWGDGFEFR